jgi:hypothetical protein
MNSMGPPKCQWMFDHCMAERHGQLAACWFVRVYSNGREVANVPEYISVWQGEHQTFARLIATREAARMFGFNPPDREAIKREARTLVNALVEDPDGVFHRKPVGEKWNWVGLACFCNWYFWLPEGGREEVLGDIRQGNSIWAYWMVNFRGVCPSEVAQDPFYHAFDDPPPPLRENWEDWEKTPFDPFLPSWNQKGVASKPASAASSGWPVIGPRPEPWPLLPLGPGIGSIPGMPPPCTPFPKCAMDQAAAVGLPMPCSPAPQCLWTVAEQVAAINPAMALTSRPDGRGAYQSAPSTEPAKKNGWVVPVAAVGVALAAGLVVVAISEE